MISAWVLLSSCSSTFAPAQMKDEFFKPLDRKPIVEKRLADLKTQREPSGNQAEIDAFKNENRMLRDSIGRMQDYIAKIKAPVQAKEAMETKLVTKQDLGSERVIVKPDPVEASLTRKSQAEPLSLVQPANRAYTVQIGAFGRGMLHIALRLQKTAQEQFPSQVVLKHYYPLDGLYRVSVGKFETRNEASLLRKELMEKFPRDYSQCWVNHFAK